MPEAGRQTDGVRQGMRPAREGSDWESPFGSHKDLAITLGEAFEGFSGLGKQLGKGH